MHSANYLDQQLHEKPIIIKKESKEQKQQQEQQESTIAETKSSEEELKVRSLMQMEFINMAPVAKCHCKKCKKITATYK